jgi:hypothetical protein
MVKSRDQKIYDKEHCKFFDIKSTNENSEQNGEKKSTKKDNKPFYMKDLEREIILKKLVIYFNM